MGCERHILSINLEIFLSETELSKNAQIEAEYQKASENRTDIQNNKNDEMVKYCSECITMENIIQVEALQSELDLKFHQARRNCHQCQFKVSLLHQHIKFSGLQ